MNTNFERAERVTAIVASYATSNYWGGEDLEAVLGDLVSDLMHFANLASFYVDRLPANVSPGDEFDIDPADVIARGVNYFDYERTFHPNEETD